MSEMGNHNSNQVAGAHFARATLHTQEHGTRDKHARVLNCGIVGAFICLIASFAGFWVLDHLNLPLSSALQLDRDRSNLEGKEYARFPELGLAALSDSEFQDGVESFINDRMPRRDDILLLNASWQRGLISCSAAVHDFSVYSTFYGSAYVYDADNDAIYALLDDADEYACAQYNASADAFTSYAASRPETNFYFYRVDRLSSSSNNPTNNLMNNVVNTGFLTDHFFNRLQGIEVIDGLQSSQDESINVFFRTDHHWNGLGAYDAYIDMFSAMQPEAEPLRDVQYVTFNDPEFYGSCARAGLCMTNAADIIEDYTFDMTGFRVWINGEEVGAQALQHTQLYADHGWDDDRFRNRYAEYWHTDYAIIQIENPASTSDESLLIVRDSFSAPVERYFADYYRNVYVVDPRYFDASLDDCLEDYGPDDVLFLMGSTTFASDNAVKFLS